MLNSWKWPIFVLQSSRRKTYAWYGLAPCIDFISKSYLIQLGEQKLSPNRQKYIYIYILQGEAKRISIAWIIFTECYLSTLNKNHLLYIVYRIRTVHTVDSGRRKSPEAAGWSTSTCIKISDNIGSIWAVENSPVTIIHPNTHTTAWILCYANVAQLPHKSSAETNRCISQVSSESQSYSSSSPCGLNVL